MTNWILVDAKHIDGRQLVEVRCEHCGYRYVQDLENRLLEKCPDCGERMLVQ